MGNAAWLLAIVACAACDGGRHHSGPDGGPIDAAHDARPDADVEVDAMIDAGPPPCIPRTCESPTLACTAVPDGCGGPMLDCGCGTGLTCGANEPGVCGVAPANRWCLATGYCWEHPLPFGFDLTAAYGASATDLWATGNAGLILRWNGTAWSKFASGTTADLYSVWGTGANDLWIGGAQWLRHWNGTALAAGTAPQSIYVHAIRGLAANDLWIAGDKGSGTVDTSHYNGVTWTGSSTGEFFGLDTIWPFSANLAWAFGFSSTAAQYANGAWTELATAPDWMLAQWGVSSTDHWAVGSGGHHWNGTTWTEDTSLGGFQYAVDGLATNDVWVGGQSGLHHYDGTAWTALGVTAHDVVRGLWLHAGATGVAVGDAGYSATLANGTWTKRSGFGDKYAIDGLVGFGDHDVALVGDGFQAWHDGTVSSYGRTNDVLHEYTDAMWASSPTSAWAFTGFGAARLVHFDGTTWSLAATLSNTPEIAAMWGTSDTDIWAVTRPVDVFDKTSPSYVVHWDGTTLARVFTTPWTATADSAFALDVNVIGGSSSTDIWIAGGGHIGHWNGATWDASMMISATALVDQFWTSSSGTLWVAATDGIYKRSGSTFVEVGDRYNGGRLAGTTDTDVFVTYSNDLQHWNGSTWITEPVGAGAYVSDIYVTATTIFAALDTGALLRKAR